MMMDVLFSSAVNAGLPVALWRLPGGGDQVKAVIELSKAASRMRVRFEGSESGFAISSFINPECRETLFVRGDLAYDASTGKLTEDPNLAGSAEKQELKAWLAQLLTQQKNTPKTNQRMKWHNNKTAPSSQSEREKYCKLVIQGIEAIATGRYHKLVLSRTRIAPLSEHFTAVKMFECLCREYPSAFIFLVSLPSVGTWMGATPEILISLDRKGILSTMALGGTVVIKSEGQPEPAWERKELDEHKFISQYIADCFKKVGVDKLAKNGPRTSIAGKLYHLKTDFSAQLDSQQNRQVVVDLVELLHPTPAVCGLPKEEAIAFLTAHEGYHRELYTGFLGPVNMDGESHLFVNLRSMQLYNDQAILYSGAGVTIESDPAKEWEETEAKSGTLFRVIADVCAMR